MPGLALPLLHLGSLYWTLCCSQLLAVPIVETKVSYKCWQQRHRQCQAPTVSCCLSSLGRTLGLWSPPTMSFAKLAALAALATVASGEFGASYLVIRRLTFMQRLSRSASPALMATSLPMRRAACSSPFLMTSRQTCSTEASAEKRCTSLSVSHSTTLLAFPQPLPPPAFSGE